MSASQSGSTSADAFRGDDGRVQQGWRTSLGSLVGLTLSPSVLQVMSLGVFTPYLRETFGWGLAQISFAAMILAIMVTVVSPIQGLLIDRFGARRLILTSIPLFGFGYAALSFLSGDLTQFYLLWGLLPVLGIGLWPGSYVKATSSWFDRRLGLAIAVATIGIGIGAALLPMIISMLTQSFGWRAAFAAIGLASVAIAWPVAILFIRDKGRATKGAPSPAAELPTGGSAARPFAILFLAFLLLGVFSTAILFHLVSVLIGNGMDRGAAVGAMSVLGMMMIAGRLGSGIAVDHVSVRIVLPIVAVAAAIAMMLLAGGATGPGALVAAALAGALIGAEIDVLGFVVKRYFGLARYGTLYGILFAVFQFGGALGVYGMAAARESSGSYVSGLVALAAACVAAAVLFAVLGPYRYGSRRAAPLAAPRAAVA